MVFLFGNRRILISNNNSLIENVEPLILPLISGIFTTEKLLTATPAIWPKTPKVVTGQWWRAETLLLGLDHLTDDDESPLYLDINPIQGATNLNYTTTIADRGYVLLYIENAIFDRSISMAQSLSTDMIEYTDLLNGSGSFSVNTGWTLGTGWTIADDKLIGVPAATTTTANRTITAPASTIRLKIDVKRLVAGTVTLRLSGPPHGVIAGSPFTNVGDDQFVDLVTSGNNTIGVLKSISFDGDVDNLRAYRIA